MLYFCFCTDTSVKDEWSFKDDYGSVDFQLTYYKKGDPPSARIKNVTIKTKDGFVIKYIYKQEVYAEYTFQVCYRCCSYLILFYSSSSFGSSPCSFSLN